MAVYFVFRSHYDEPSGKCLRRFDDATVLDWFRRHWGLVDEEDVASERIDELLGWPVEPFTDLFGAAYRLKLPPPEAIEQLEEYLLEHYDGTDGTVLCEPNVVTIRSVDDCNMEACSYLFDDAYLAEHGPRAAFLLHEGWQLPGGHAEAGGYEPGEPTEEIGPPGDGAGTSYLVFLFYDYENEGNLSGLWGGQRIEGVRIPDLAAWLALKLDSVEDRFLLLLRSQLFAAPFTRARVEEGFRQVLLKADEDADAWRQQAEPALMAYSDWLQERQDRPAGLLFLEQALKALFRLPVAHLPDCEGGPIGAVRRRLQAALENDEVISHIENAPVGDDAFPLPRLCHFHVEEHLAQLCLNTEHWRGFRRAELYHQWIFFDDRWAAAHPELADAILRYARCWDVLSPDGPQDGD
jgi:hypothetical protein